MVLTRRDFPAHQGELLRQAGQAGAAFDHRPADDCGPKVLTAGSVTEATGRPVTSAMI